MTVGLGTYAFTWAFGIPGQPQPPEPMTHERLIDLAVELGAQVVQFADNAPLHELAAQPGGRARVTEIASRARSAGIAIELGTRGTDPALLREYLGLAGRVDATILRSVPTGAVDDARATGAGEYADAVVADVRAVVGELESAGVTLCLENYEGCPVALLADVVNRIDSPRVRVCLDSLNSLGRSEGFRTVADTLAPLTGNLHVKDYAVRRVDHRLGFLVEGTPAGEGVLPVRELASLVPLGVTAVLELWTPWQGTIARTIETEADWARRSMAYLNATLGE